MVPPCLSQLPANYITIAPRLLFPAYYYYCYYCYYCYNRSSPKANKNDTAGAKQG